MRPESRELEIAEWLRDHNDVRDFVILDDMWSMGTLNECFLRCLPFNGITAEIAAEAIKKLSEEKNASQ